MIVTIVVDGRNCCDWLPLRTTGRILSVCGNVENADGDNDCDDDCESRLKLLLNEVTELVGVDCNNCCNWICSIIVVVVVVVGDVVVVVVVIGYTN